MHVRKHITYVHTHIDTYICIQGLGHLSQPKEPHKLLKDIHVFSGTYMYTCINAYIHTYICTYILT